MDYGGAPEGWGCLMAVIYCHFLFTQLAFMPGLGTLLIQTGQMDMSALT